MNFLKKTAAVVVLLVFSLLLSGLTFPWNRGASSPTDESSPIPTAEPTPAPTPSPSPISVLGTLYPADTESLTLNLCSSDIPSVLSSLLSFPNLTHLTIAEDPSSASPITVEDYISLAKALYKTEIDCTFDLFGQTFNTVRTERLEYLQTPIGDAGLDVFWHLLPHLQHLSYLSFDRCDTTDEACATLRDAFPKTEIVWRVFFPPFTCMTDVETIWASVDLRDETCSALKYCTRVRNLDIGHSAMTDLSFLDYMPDLEVLIIACSDFEDISHIASCKNLKYLEVCECFRLTDLSPICALKNLEHLNVGDLTVSDISCLHSLTECKNLKRFYAPNMRSYALDMDKEAAIFQQLLPGVELNFDKSHFGLGSLNGYWRYTGGYECVGSYTEPYKRIREIFRYDDGILAQPRLYY